MDRLQFEALYERHRAAVRAYVTRRAGEPAVDDVLAQVWLTAWRRRDSLPPDPLPWLYGTARRALANERRGRRRWTALLSRAAFEHAAAHEEASAASARVLEALGRLPERDREAILLVAWEGLDNAAAAQVLGCSTAAFATRLHRARRQLKVLLDDNDERSPSGRTAEVRP